MSTDSDEASGRSTSCRDCGGPIRGATTFHRPGCDAGRTTSWCKQCGEPCTPTVCDCPDGCHEAGRGLTPCDNPLCACHDAPGRGLTPCDNPLCACHDAPGRVSSPNEEAAMSGERHKPCDGCERETLIEHCAACGQDWPCAGRSPSWQGRPPGWGEQTRTSLDAEPGRTTSSSEEAEMSGDCHSPDDDCPKTHLRSLIDGGTIVVHEPGYQDPCPECFPWRPDARVRYRCERHKEDA